MSDSTTIPLDKTTRDRLRLYGVKGQTWNTILIELMNEIDKLRKE